MPSLTWEEFWFNRPVYQKIGAVVGISLSLFYIYTALFGNLDALMQRSIHLGLGLILTFFVHTTGRSRRGRTLGTMDAFLAIAAVAVISYVFARYDWITVDRFLLVSEVTWYEKVLGVTTLLLVLEGARRVISPGMLYVGAAFLLYPLAAPYFPGGIAFSLRGLDGSG